MPMTMVVTRDVAPRFRGFLASCMLELAPGVYTAPQMSRGVRERVETVLSAWFDESGSGSIVMTWYDRREPGRQGVRVFGLPPRRIVEVDGMLLTKLAASAEGAPEAL